MEFYFCERCGKRVTEHDLKQGQARNKKLRGYYCDNCQAGVQTIEFEPIAGENPHARRRPSNAAASPPLQRAPTKAILTHRTDSSKSMLAAEARRRRGDSKPKSSNRYAALGVVAGLLGFTGTIFLLLSTRQPPQNHKANKSLERPVQDAATPERQKPLEMLEAHIGPPRKPAIPAPEPDVAKEPPQAEPFKPPLPEKMLPSVDRQEKPAHDAKQTETPPAQPTLESAFLKETLDLLSNGNLHAGMVHAQKSTSREAAAVATALSEVKKLDEDYLGQLRQQVGKPVSLNKKGEKVEGKLLEVDSSTVKLEIALYDRGRPVGAMPKHVDVPELLEQARENNSARKTEPAWIGLAMLHLSQEHFERARHALEQAKSHALYAELSRLTIEREQVFLESNAEPNWASIEHRMKENLSTELARDLLKRVADFETRFGMTAWAGVKQNRSRMEQTRKLVELLAKGAEYRVLKLFRGQVSNFDPKTMSLTVHYDFKSAEQLKDFAGGELFDSTRLLELGGLWMEQKQDRHALLRLPQFISEGAHVTIDYQKLRNDSFVAHFQSDRAQPTEHLRLTTGQKGGYVFRVMANGTANQVHFQPWPREGTLKAAGRIEFSSCQGKLSISLNNELILTYQMQEPESHNGIAVGPGTGTQFVITGLTATGALNPNWVRESLKQ